MSKKLRVIFVGHNTVQYIHDNWATPLANRNPTVFLNATLPLLAGGGKYLEAYIQYVIRHNPVDLLFFFSDGIIHQVSQRFFDTLRSQGIPSVTFHADDEPDYWYNRNTRFDACFDLIATPSIRGYTRRCERLGEHRVIYLPWGFNETMFLPNPTPKKFDIIHIGTNFWSTDTQWNQESKERLQTLEKLYWYCLKKGYKMRIFGAGWKQHHTLSACYGGIVTRDEMIALYQSSKLVLNPGYSKDGENSTYQVKLRHFETAGCGACQLVNDNPEIRGLFEPGREIITYRNDSELIEAVHHLLATDSERSAIAEAAGRRAHQYHTTAHRIDHLLEEARKRLLADNTGIIPNRLNHLQIYTLYADTLDEVKDIISNIGPSSSSYDYIHLIVGKLHCIDLAYSQLPDNLVSIDADAISTRAFLQLAGIQPGEVQRKEENISGQVVGPLIAKTAIPKNTEDLIVGGNFEDGIRPFFNYLVRPSSAKAFFSALSNNDYQRFAEFRVFHSGWLLGDFAPADFERLVSETCHPWEKRLELTLDNLCSGSRQRILICAAKGLMADKAHKTALSINRRLPGRLELLGFVDKAYAGMQYLGLAVYDYQDIESLDPDIIVIAAESSGPSIMASLNEQAMKCVILPLYDLANPAWDLNYPSHSISCFSS